MARHVRTKSTPGPTRSAAQRSSCDHVVPEASSRMPVRDASKRVLAHEWTLACLGGLLLAMTMLWLMPAVLSRSRGGSAAFPDLSHTIPGDVWDPTLQAWQIAWD